MIHQDHKIRMPSRGVVLGTCAAISDASGVPALGLRIVAVVALCIWFKLALLAYCGLAIYYRFRG